MSEELAEGYTQMMLERLRDKQPAVRCQAALALARLADPGEEGDFAGDCITDSYIRLLGTEKNKVGPLSTSSPDRNHGRCCSRQRLQPPTLQVCFPLHMRWS